jgi:heterotetrameric sarcosine oxidase gamma subunit
MRRTCVSAPEDAASRGVWLTGCDCDVIELSTYTLAAADARRRVAGVELPAFGQVSRGAGHLALSVRPGRWLLLTTSAAPGLTAARWAAACAGQGAVVDLSSALAVLVLAGAKAREMLARGCRLDLAPAEFRSGQAAATIMAQVAVTLVALPDCLLLLTPASTAQHLREWLTATAAPFGLMRVPAVTFSDVCGE